VGKKEVAYFSVLFYSILITFFYFIKYKRTSLLSTFVHIFLFFGAFYLCWMFIFQFINEDIKSAFMKGGDFYSWLGTSNIFFKSYINVVKTNVAYWWTSQLLLWALSFGVFISIESNRNGLNVFARMAYMLLGLLAAIAVSASIFTTLVPHPNEKDNKGYNTNAPKVSFLFVVFIFIGIICIFLLPKIHATFPFAFRVVLIVLHVVVAFPVFIPLSNTEKGDSARYALCALYAFLAGVSLVFHIINSLEIFLPLLKDKQWFDIKLYNQLLGMFLKSNDCQTSVSFDVIFCALITFLMILKVNPLASILSILLMPILSPSVIFPAFLLYRELKMIRHITPTYLLNKKRQKNKDNTSTTTLKLKKKGKEKEESKD